MIGEEIKQKLFRNTPDYYLNASEDYYYQKFIDLCKQYCGKRVLDFGCATGNYMTALQKLGYDCVGVDANPAYIEIAAKKNFDVYLIDDKLPFPDKHFDSAIMFEVLEHLQNPLDVLKEIKRVARKNIILTVPNCEGFNELKNGGLAFEHFFDLDHKNYFTPDSLRNLLDNLFKQYEIKIIDPIVPYTLMKKSILRFIVHVLYKIKLIKPKFYFRIVVVIDLKNQI
ncbi:MAG: class I SAM-dependent methyltransferase [Bacteroidota bacterium]|nr:class I SAM-dependent methyltransferase [Bacteroidota bacterium]